MDGAVQCVGISNMDGSILDAPPIRVYSNVFQEARTLFVHCASTEMMIFPMIRWRSEMKTTEKMMASFVSNCNKISLRSVETIHLTLSLRLN